MSCQLGRSHRLLVETVNHSEAQCVPRCFLDFQLDSAPLIGTRPVLFPRNCLITRYTDLLTTSKKTLQQRWFDVGELPKCLPSSLVSGQIAIGR